MADPFRQLPSGASPFDISRQAYNELLKMLAWWRNESSGQGSSRTQRTATEILVKNSTDETVPAFGALSIGEPLIFPTDDPYACLQRPAMNGIAPTADSTWVALLEPAGPGEIARAVLAGIAMVRLYVNSANDKYCGPADARTIGDETIFIDTGETGIPILWKESVSSGVAYAIVLLGGGNNSSAPVRCQALLVSAIDGTRGPFYVYRVTSISGDNPTASLAENVAVYNPIGFHGSADGWCIISQIKEASYDNSIAAGQFIFDMIACPTS